MPTKPGAFHNARVIPMPIENEIDCPALHKRSSSYPFGDRVPRTVRILKTVTANPMRGVGLAYIKAMRRRLRQVKTILCGQIAITPSQR